MYMSVCIYTDTPDCTIRKGGRGEGYGKEGSEGRARRGGFEKERVEEWASQEPSNMFLILKIRIK